MAEFIKKKSVGEHLGYHHKGNAIIEANRFINYAKSRVAYLLLPLFFLSPFFFYMFLFATIAYFFKSLWKTFFSDRRLLARYVSILSPKNSPETTATIGYQVFENEIPEHLNIVKRDDREARKILAEMQKKNMTWRTRFKRIGFSKGLILRHLLVIGATGSGKSEMIRSIFNDGCFKLGSSGLYLDGKSDMKLAREFVSQANKMGRETSVRILNFLKPEVMAETNTFSPLGIMHPVKAVNFIGSLTGGDENTDGNGQYFYYQGIAMFSPVVMITYIRNKYFSEGYNLEKLFQNTEIENMVLLRNTAYCMCRDANKKIDASNKLTSYIATMNTNSQDETLHSLVSLIAYITQFPTKVNVVEEETGWKYSELKELYLNGYYLMNTYLVKSWNMYSSFLDITGRVLYEIGQFEDLVFFGEEAISIMEIRKLVSIMKTGTKDSESINKFREDYELEDIIEAHEFETLHFALHRPSGEGGNIFAPSSDASQQIAYAVSQFSSLSNIFAMFNHVFGQTTPEIRPEKLLKDNQFLYILLPPLEQDPGTTKVIAKIIIKTIQELAAIAMMGEEISVHKTLGNIFKDKLTPKPYSFVVLDEYGGYPVEISLLVAQLRSILVGLCIGVQDQASLKTNGESITSLERALGNTTKVVMRTEDKEMINWIKETLSDIKVEAPKLQKDMHNNWVTTIDVDIKDEKTMKAETVKDFGNGFGMLLLGSKEEDIVFVQTYYRGGNPDTIFLRRYLNLYI